MRSLLIAILAIVSSLTFATESQAGGRWKRCWNGSCYSYQYVPEVAVQSQTTVVNNLIGIPVPVQYSEPIAAQGTTVYGYSSLAESYNQVDMGLLYNQAARLTDQAQQLAGQASVDFSALVQAEGQNRAEVAKILAQGQAAREALSASKGEQLQLQTSKSFSFKVTQDTTGDMKVEKIQDFNLVTPNTANISDLLTTRCIACHKSDTKQGNLDLSGEISSAQQIAILKRVTTDDLEKRMPRRVDGTAGAKLTLDELNTLFNAMGPALHQNQK